MVNNCLLTAYWCVCISLPLRRGREVGQSGSSVCSRLRAAWLLQLSVQLQKGRLGREERQDRETGGGERISKKKKRKGTEKQQKSTEMEKKLKEMRED